MPSSARQLREIPPRYTAIMHEIRIRIAAIRAGVDGYLSVLPPWVTYEHCHLQIRLICELIASACLLAHGDIPAAATKKILDEWHAEKIFATLEKLHPDFYPQPLFLRPRPSYESPLPKRELISAYHKCGEVLHRGGLGDLFSRRAPTTSDWDKIKEVVDKIYQLLYVHQITTLDGQFKFIVTLYRKGTGNIGMGTFLKDGPGPKLPWWDDAEIDRIIMGTRKN